MSWGALRLGARLDALEQLEGEDGFAAVEDFDADDGGAELAGGGVGADAGAPGAAGDAVEAPGGGGGDGVGGPVESAGDEGVGSEVVLLGAVVFDSVGGGEGGDAADNVGFGPKQNAPEQTGAVAGGHQQGIWRWQTSQILTSRSRRASAIAHSMHTQRPRLFFWISSSTRIEPSQSGHSVS